MGKLLEQLDFVFPCPCCSNKNFLSHSQFVSERLQNFPKCELVLQIFDLKLSKFTFTGFGASEIFKFHFFLSKRSCKIGQFFPSKFTCFFKFSFGDCVTFFQHLLSLGTPQGVSLIGLVYPNETRLLYLMVQCNVSSLFLLHFSVQTIDELGGVGNFLAARIVLGVRCFLGKTFDLVSRQSKITFIESPGNVLG